MKYNDWTLGQVEAVFNKLGGDDGVRRFLAGELVVKPVQPELKVFKTIKLGTNGLRTADDFRKALKDNGFSIGDYANDILGKPAFTAATEETELDLVVISVAELGFKNGATREQIYARTKKEFGLDLCPAEVGPQLRLQYKDQPNNEWLVIAMEPITGSDGGLRLFYVGRSASALWFSCCCAWPGGVWYSDSRFVFSRRNSLCFSTFLGGFYFNDLIHPPNILPVSFIFSESKIYFLLSNDFIFHEICKKNLSKSNLTEAILRKISFSVLSELLAFIISSITPKNKESTFAPRSISYIIPIF